MSKASEWAERCDKHEEELKFYESAGDLLGTITAQGNLDLKETIADSKDALKLAHWIIDTFGEEESALDAFEKHALDGMEKIHKPRHLCAPEPNPEDEVF